MNPVTNSDIIELCDNEFFTDARPHELVIQDSPFRRPTRLKDSRYIDFDLALTLEDMESNESLSTQRILLNIYEMGMLFLPAGAGSKEAFDAFYGERLEGLAGKCLPVLEKKAFSFLNQAVKVSGNWDCDVVMAYFHDHLAREGEKIRSRLVQSELHATILNSRRKEDFCTHYVIQMASDFLTEASAMSTLAGGSYAPVQSDLFKILIDEYGAGIHENKHSTLFEDLLKSLGLRTNAHAYWQFYHPSSLMLVTYFHFVTRHKRNFFKYIGALFYTESSLAATSRLQCDLVEQVYGGRANGRYFSEHAHIDQHHGRKVLHDIIAPLVKAHGPAAARQMVVGFEEFKLLQELADKELMNHFKWLDAVDFNNERTRALEKMIEFLGPDRHMETYIESAGERTTTHIHPDNRLLMMESGHMDFWPIHGQALRISPGDRLVVPRGRLHGAIVTDCMYHQPLIDGLEFDEPGDAGSALARQGSETRACAIP